MKKLNMQIFSIFLISILLFSGLSFAYSETQKSIASKGNDDFYFVQITDTHVMHKIFDRNEKSKNRFKSVLAHVCSFEKKPAFIVVTGDLTNWGGSWISGALNCRAFVSCLYEKDGQFYADENYSVAVYTTPGNHDYNFNRNLKNYYRFIKDNKHYVVNYGDISLFFMNSGPSYYGKFYDWLGNIDGAGFYNYDIQWLTDAFDNCSSSYKIVLMHHPAIDFRQDNGQMHDVFARNRQVFIDLCEDNNVELVLTGHTHSSRVFDKNENPYIFNDSLNCSLYSTLYVQTDDNKHGLNYRNISMIGNDIWMENTVKL